MLPMRTKRCVHVSVETVASLVCVWDVGFCSRRYPGDKTHTIAGDNRENICPMTPNQEMLEVKNVCRAVVVVLR